MSDLGTPAAAPAAAPASAPAPAAPSTPAPAASAEAPSSSAPPAKDTRTAAERARDPSGRFAKRSPGPTKQRLMRESLSFGENRETPAVADDAPKTEAVAEAPKTEAVEPKPEPKAEPEKPAITDDPQTWPENVRVAHEAVRSELESHKAENSKWREVGPKAVEQNRRLAEENKLLRSMIQQANLQVDQRDLDLIGFRVKEETSQQQQQWAQQRAEAEKAAATERQRAEGQRQAQALVQSITEQAKAAGVPAQEVGLLVHSQLAVMKKADVAAAVQQVKDRLLLQQRKVNEAAPTPVRAATPSSNLQPHDRSRAGKEARLKQWGAS